MGYDCTPYRTLHTMYCPRLKPPPGDCRGCSSVFVHSFGSKLAWVCMGTLGISLSRSWSVTTSASLAFMSCGSELATSRKSDHVSRVFGGSFRRVETERGNSTKLVECKILHTRIVCKILHSRPNMAILMISLATSPTSTSQPNTGWLSVTNRSSRTQTKYSTSPMGTAGPDPPMLHLQS